MEAALAATVLGKDIVGQFPFHEGALPVAVRARHRTRSRHRLNHNCRNLENRHSQEAGHAAGRSEAAAPRPLRIHQH